MHPGGSGMSDHRPSRVGRASLPLSIVLGMILVPLTAVAAVIMVSPDSDQEPVSGAALPAAEVSSTAAMAGITTTIPEPTLATDLADACGPAGRRLVDQEKEGSNSDTQQAALDALRPVCDAVGMSLPAAPEQRVETIVVESSVTSQPSPSASISVPNDDDDDEDEDEWEDD